MPRLSLKKFKCSDCTSKTEDKRINCFLQCRHPDRNPTVPERRDDIKPTASPDRRENKPTLSSSQAKIKCRQCIKKPEAERTHCFTHCDSGPVSRIHRPTKKHDASASPTPNTTPKTTKTKARVTPSPSAKTTSKKRHDADGDDDADKELSRLRSRNKITWIAVCILTTFLSATTILSVWLRKRKVNRITPVMVKIGKHPVTIT